MDRWPFVQMPEWFADRFAHFVSEAHWMGHTNAAEKFWLEILTHEDFPTAETPNLKGYEGWRYICPEGKSGRGHSLAWAGQDASEQRRYYCHDCKKHYALMDDLRGVFEEMT